MSRTVQRISQVLRKNQVKCKEVGPPLVRTLKEGRSNGKQNSGSN